ncbi:DegQ family serine endoprotease [Microbaculum marinisediminis]|uniref:DegQ family serine endoprotease n=1 Tax=Microbaculum marinisediminis TaxID=2931392 RepID=A0AAW5R5U8_9HYPH|nr:DegQ family serine endoprotease [Microbaculum sp. A6E488]MCT8974489.1 DegQ family serine endoprotease [Microbaculum sp. A6E488]
MIRTLFVAAVAALFGALPASAQTKVVPDSEAAITYSYAPIVKQAAPAVVNVYSSRVVRQSNMPPFFNDPFFRRFFGGPDAFGQRERVQKSLGSGVIVDPSGFVVTNAHVIDGADEVKVALSDRREFEAEVVLKDERTDLAVLKIEGDKPFPALAFADSDALEVGDIVLAIGDPFGVGQTVTSGIVSALARTQVGVSDYGFFIQTDAPINPGNSGGALLDMQGRVVGINTAIYSRSGGSHGIGFAIPANMVRLVVAGAQSGGGLKRPWFGASVQEVTPDIADSLGMDRPVGVLVANLHPEGPAAEAGLKTGDVIVAVQGNEVLDPNAFRYRIATRGVDTETTLDVISRGETRTIKVALIAPPEEPARDARDLDGPSPLTGIRVANLSPAVADELSLDSEATGVVVVSIQRGSPAQRVGFRVGDTIHEINGETIETSEQLDGYVKERRRAWKVTIVRDGRMVTSVFGG